MCEISAFYHLCGHLNKSTTHFCSACIHERIEQQTRSPESPRIKRPPARCNPSPTHTYLIPTLCESCIGNSEVHEYLESNPTAKFEVFRSWKASLRLEKAKAMAEVEGRAAWRLCPVDEDSDDSSSADSMPFMAVSEVSSSASAMTQRTSLDDSEDGEIDTKGSGSIAETKGRIAALKGRVVNALASITY